MQAINRQQTDGRRDRAYSRAVPNNAQYRKFLVVSDSVGPVFESLYLLEETLLRK